MRLRSKLVSLRRHCGGACAARLAAIVLATALALMVTPTGCGGADAEQDCETACGSADPCTFIPTRDNSSSACAPACKEQISFDEQAGCAGQSQNFYACASMLTNGCDALVDSPTAPCDMQLNAYTACVLAFCAKHPSADPRVCR
jgi:hypothetical protein